MHYIRLRAIFATEKTDAITHLTQALILIFYNNIKSEVIMQKNPPQKNLLKLFSAFIFYSSIAALVYLATSKQVPTINVSHFDKIQHMAAFGWLTIFAFLAWRQVAVQRFAVIFMISMTIELAQVFISYRSASWYDLVANAAGILLAEFIVVRLLKRVVS